MIDSTQITYETSLLSQVRMTKEDATGKRFLLEINGKQFKVKDKGRFFTSLNRKFNLNNTFYNLFSPEEVFARVVRNRGDVSLRFAIENNRDVLGVSYGESNILSFEQCIDFLNKKNPVSMHYNNGKVSAMFERDDNNSSFDIGGDEFQHRHALSIPIDGMGTPKFYVSLLRLVCMNGMTGYSNEFATPVNLDRENPIKTLERATDNFKSEESYRKLEDKMQESQGAALSVREALKIQQLLERTECGSKNLGDYLRMVNMTYYGSKDLLQNSKDLNAMLPCTDGQEIVSVYDAINFLTELSTHKAKDNEMDKINAYVGTVLTKDFDLPNVAENKNGFEELFLNKGNDESDQGGEDE